MRDLLSAGIIDLPRGELIREPGFYRTPIDWHHSQCCDGVSVTSGTLRKMELCTPADVWAFHALNPDPWEPEETEALHLGRAMAAFVEGGMDQVEREFLILTGGEPRRPTAAQRRAYERVGEWSDAARPGAEFWAEADAEGKPVLTAKQAKLIASMGRALAADPAAQAVLDGEPEITMAWKDEETGLWFLARPDLVNFDGFVGDYKKMASGGQPFSYRVVDRRITDHGYDMQLAFAAEVFERLTGFWPDQAAIIAQWDKRPHHIILREIAEEDLRLGQFRNRAAARRFRECLEIGHWPGPGEDVGAYQRPDWQRDWLMQRQDTETGRQEAPESEGADEDDPITFGF